jgi:hypothetical protein
MKQVEQDISNMTDEQLQAFIVAHIATMERSDKELYARQLEAGYWQRISQPKRPPEVPALVWYCAQNKRRQVST